MGWYDRRTRQVRDLSCGDTRIYLNWRFGAFSAEVAAR